MMMMMVMMRRMVMSRFQTDRRQIGHARCLQVIRKTIRTVVSIDDQVNRCVTVDQHTCGQNELDGDIPEDIRQFPSGVIV